ncbi:MAG: GSU2086 family protein [Planctomycetota bacterium]
MSKQKKDYKPIDLEGIKSYPIKRRKNLVSIKQFAKTIEHKGFSKFLDSLPDILAGNSIRDVINAIAKATNKNRPVVMAIGAHVIKCGLSPIIIDLMKRGIITAVAMNGSVAIHDYEISLIGETSEDVSHSLKDGSFGMARETAEAFQAAVSLNAAGQGNKQKSIGGNIGLGRALGKQIIKDKNKYKQYSILATGAKLGIPTTVHVAIGTEIIHMHPCISGGDMGESSHVDFKILCSVVANLEGGVWMNIGSAVIMPEVFLKALSVARNLGKKVEDFTAVNMDMIQHYRPQTNVVKRPTTQGYSITGHHEIMLPLLRLGILSKLKK